MKKRLFAALMAVAAITCTACSAASDSVADSKSYTANAAETISESVSFGVRGSDAALSESGNVGSLDATDALSERKIIKTMHITAETKAFDAATLAIESLCTQLGGYIESSSRSGGSIRNSSAIIARSASYTLRIPAEQLDAFRNGISSDIHIVDESAQINDITDSYFDVDTRIATLKIEEERLLAMLEQATELEYLITLEQRLSEVRYEIESYTGTIRRYDSQIAYSTVYLNLGEVIEYTAVIETPQTFGERLSIAFRESWTNFADNCKDFAVGLVYALPTLLVLLVIVAVIIAILLLLIRRTNRRNREQ